MSLKIRAGQRFLMLGRRERVTVALGLARLAAAFALSGPTDDAFLQELRTSGYSLSDEASEQTYDGRVLMVVGRRDRIAGYRDQRAALIRYPLAAAMRRSPMPVTTCRLEKPQVFAALAQCWLRG